MRPSSPQTRRPWDEITEACYHGQFSDKLDEHLDTSHGSCALRDPRLAQIVADRPHNFDGQRDDLGSDVIMPNHVHALFTLRDGESLPDTLQGWKAVSSRLIHPTGLSALNPFWLPDDFDRLIRSPEPFSTVKACIRENPAKAGLKAGLIVCGGEAKRREPVCLSAILPSSVTAVTPSSALEWDYPFGERSLGLPGGLSFFSGKHFRPLPIT